MSDHPMNYFGLHGSSPSQLIPTRPEPVRLHWEASKIGTKETPFWPGRPYNFEQGTLSIYMTLRDQHNQFVDAAKHINWSIPQKVQCEIKKGNDKVGPVQQNVTSFESYGLVQIDTKMFDGAYSVTIGGRTINIIVKSPIAKPAAAILHTAKRTA